MDERRIRDGPHAAAMNDGSVTTREHPSDQHQPPQPSLPVNFIPSEAAPQHSRNWLKWGKNSSNPSEEVMLSNALNDRPPARRRSSTNANSSPTHPSLLHRQAATSTISSISISSSPPTSDLSRSNRPRGLMRDYPDLTDLDSVPMDHDHFGSLSSRISSTNPISTSPPSLNAGTSPHRYDSNPAHISLGKSASRPSSPPSTPSTNDTSAPFVRRNSNFGWLSFGKPSSPISVPLALRSVAAQQTAMSLNSTTTSPASISPCNTIPRRGSTIGPTHQDESTDVPHIHALSFPRRHASDVSRPNSPSSDRPVFVAADLPLPHRDYMNSLSRPPLPAMERMDGNAGEDKAVVLKGAGAELVQNVVLDLSSGELQKVDMRTPEEEDKAVLKDAPFLISDSVVSEKDNAALEKPIQEPLNDKTTTAAEVIPDSSPESSPSLSPSSLLSLSSSMPRTSPEPIPTSIHNADNTSSQSIKSVPSVDEEPDYNSDSVNGNDSTAPPSSSTSSPYTRNSTPSLSPLPTDPPRHRQSRLRSYQFLFSGTSKHRVEESSTASQAETFDTEATKDASIDPTPIEPEKPRRTRKHTHSVFLNTQSRWSPIPLFRSLSAPNIDLILTEETTPTTSTPPCDMDGLHPVDASSHHPARHSLDVVVAAQHLGVTESELPRILAEEGISRWAAVKATSIKTTSPTTSAGHIKRHPSPHSHKQGVASSSASFASRSSRGIEGHGMSRADSITSMESNREHRLNRSGTLGLEKEGERRRRRRSGYVADEVEEEGSFDESGASESDDVPRRPPVLPRALRRESEKRYRERDRVVSSAASTRSSRSSKSSKSARRRERDVAVQERHGGGGGVTTRDVDDVKLDAVVVDMNGIVGIVDDTGMGGKRPARRKTVKESSGSVPSLLLRAAFSGDGKSGDDKVSTHTIVQGLDDDDMAVKRDFLIKLSRTFAMYGAPSHRLEYHLSLVSKTLEVEADYIVFPGMIMISFGGESSHSNTHIVKTAQGFNMGKLAQVNALCLTLTHGLIDVYDAVDLLEAVKADNDYPWYIILATFPVTSFTLCILGFGGNWVDAMIAAVLGLFVGILSLLSERYSSVTYLLEFFASLCTAFIARSLQWILGSRGICFNYIAIVLSSIAILLPGLSLTISIIELSTRNMVSGTVRLFGALFTAMLLGFGMTIGGALVFWNSYPSSGTTSSACGAPQNPLWALLLFWPMSFAVNIFFQANMHQWPIMTASAALGWITSLLLNMAPHFQTNASAVTAISSLVIGLVSNLHSRLTHDVAVAPVLSGILLQVPGSLGVRSSLSFFVSTSQSNQSIVDGVQFTFQMLTIGMSLALGLFVATFLVWPLRGPKYKYLTI